MKRFEHINFDQRKIINNRITTYRDSAKAISELVGLDPTSISKELKRNRYISKEASSNIKDPICKKTLRYPYVCNGCDLKYTCKRRQYRYEASRAQNNASYNLVANRSGINLTKEEFDILDRKIKDGLSNHRSIYDIVTGDKDINVSVATVYRYIDNDYLSVRKIDLPYAVKLKKRKKKIKEYDYPYNSKINRTNHTYLDYLAFKEAHINSFVVQMDFLGSIKTDVTSILTLVWPDLHFCMIRKIKKKNSKRISEFFNQLESFLGIEDFKKIFPCILTDRDPSFSDIDGIEVNNITGEVRTRLFFCDSFMSNQKASVENMNKQLRLFFPKKQSIDSISRAEINLIMTKINDSNKASLSRYSANEAFKRVYGEKLWAKLNIFEFFDEENNE